MILRASSLLAPDGRVREGGVLVEGGTIQRVIVGTRALRRESTVQRVVDLGEGLLAPGFVNAHAHLELGALAGRLPEGIDFVRWVRALLGERSRLDVADFGMGVERGAARLLETGTTTVGDIASDERTAGLRRGGLRTVLYREVLDGGDAGRAGAALRTLRRRLPARRLRTEGVSPHAPYTLSSALIAGLTRQLDARPRPVSIHWAETAEEVRWLERGEGPFSAILSRSPCCSPLEHLERGGLLRGVCSLVHGNHPGEGDPARIARLRVSLVHCPGSHTFFRREPFPLDVYHAAGASVALGTDSLASNADLDMGRELALLRTAHPQVSPEEAMRMATVEGARALGLGGRVGELAPGRLADLAFHRVDPSAPLEALTTGEGEVAGVWVGGRRVFRRLSGGFARPAGGAEG